MEWLIPWEIIELYRQKVANVSMARGATKCLIKDQSEPRKEQLQASPGEGLPAEQFVNVLRQLKSGASSLKQYVLQASSHYEVDFEENENVGKKEPKPCVCRAKGLMYIDAKINGKPIKAMVDTGVTHNYLVDLEVERLGLFLEKGDGKVKTINSVAQSIVGVAKSVLIKDGLFEVETNLSEV
ncbi:Uncharacterized protein Adt_21158 [Abeliophyllum distichum]|uniref:Uncharacterized protein n=1 Tax=Abeliophyllum distichum TaxID=126358 RepID=A0ABD1SYM7_9LAMI